MADLLVLHGVPDHIRSDNGPKFVAKVVRGWLDRPDVYGRAVRLEARDLLRQADEGTSKSTLALCYN